MVLCKTGKQQEQIPPLENWGVWVEEEPED